MPSKVLQLVNGQIAELALVLGARGLTTVDFGTGKTDTTVAVTGQTEITALHVPMAVVACVATAEHSADEHFVEEIEVRCGAVVPGVGFTIYARTQNFELSGRFSVAWSWG